jgi:hypothetical protein
MCGFPVCAQGLRHELSDVREKLLEAKTATMTELLQVGMSAACVILSDSFSMSRAQQIRSCWMYYISVAIADVTLHLTAA